MYYDQEARSSGSWASPASRHHLVSQGGFQTAHRRGDRAMGPLLRPCSVPALPGIVPTLRPASVATCRTVSRSITADICWSCILPLSIGGATIGSFGGPGIAGTRVRARLQLRRQPDHQPVGRPGSRPPRRGRTQTFFCLHLSAAEPRPGIAAPEAARFHLAPRGDGDSGKASARHFYVNRSSHWLEVRDDFPCLERGIFDLATGWIRCGTTMN